MPTRSELLAELGRRLHARGLTARIFLAGGAAMALAYNARRATRDLDGVFEPKTEIYAAGTRLRRQPAATPDHATSHLVRRSL
jgi:hypothetical protein